MARHVGALVLVAGRMRRIMWCLGAGMPGEAGTRSPRQACSTLCSGCTGPRIQEGQGELPVPHIRMCVRLHGCRGGGISMH